MTLAIRLNQTHAKVRNNIWHRYFAVFCRVALAIGFIPSGFVKIFGERFTALSSLHPMGKYLDALFHTGFYYPFIGYAQVSAAILLIFPKTALLGSLIYFPIILNICMLSLALGFEGSLVSSPLMLLANTYLLCWYYDRLKFILPLKSKPLNPSPEKIHTPDRRFPKKFFLFSLGFILFTAYTVNHLYPIYPKNTRSDCISQCEKNKDPQECLAFCDCIHLNGKSFENCLKAYRK